MPGVRSEVQVRLRIFLFFMCGETNARLWSLAPRCDGQEHVYVRPFVCLTAQRTLTEVEGSVQLTSLY